MTHLPSNEVVAVAWLKGIAGVPLNSTSAPAVATTLPQDETTWPNGFIQVAVVGGTPYAYTPISEPVLQVDCWAVNPKSGKPPWGKANAVAEAVKAACYPQQDSAYRTHRTVTPTPGDYAPARIIRAQVMSEPRRLSGAPDDARYARYQMDLLLAWTAS